MVQSTRDGLSRRKVRIYFILKIRVVNLIFRYRIRYLDDDGKPYDESVDEWLTPPCVREVHMVIAQFV